MLHTYVLLGSPFSVVGQPRFSDVDGGLGLFLVDGDHMFQVPCLSKLYVLVVTLSFCVFVGLYHIQLNEAV